MSQPSFSFEDTFDAPELVIHIIKEAIEQKVSDIHIDPYEKVVLIRFRLDGLLSTHYTLSKRNHSEIIGRLKVLARLRTDVHSLPQDGKIHMVDSLSCDIRLSIIPTYYGENAVLRILSSATQSRSLDELGFTPDHQEKIRRALLKKAGLIIVTGPTGSGKTTTLYSLLSLLPHNQLIVTIEDPVEYTLDIIRQIQINPDTGLSFAHGLRSILRQDPDVIMVGEIRDEETARIALHAALTGHLVLTTLHTKDTLSVLARLQDMGIAPYLIAATLELIIAQRLVRKVCTGESGLEFKGRIGIYEFLELSPELREAIQDTDSVQTLEKIIQADCFMSLRDDGLQKVGMGHTTLPEIERVLL
jgi:type II secretory ATPase GspE/PulE/Tfp pilus assembly ATPase PilB-like protein